MKRNNRVLVLIIMLALALIYFSYATYQDDSILVPSMETDEIDLRDIDYKETFVWEIYDSNEDTYSIMVTDEEDYTIASGTGSLVSFMKVLAVETGRIRDEYAEESIIKTLNATIEYYNLTNGVPCDVTITFTIGDIPVTIYDIALQTPFNTDFDLSMFVVRTAEHVPIVKGSDLEPEELVTVIISSLQGHEYKADGTLLMQLEIIEQTIID